MTRDEALARRAEMRQEADNYDGDYWDAVGSDTNAEFDRLNHIVGLKDCKNCDRDMDIDYPDDYCPMCVLQYNPSGPDWQPWPEKAPDIPDESGVYVPWCRSGIGELRCMYPEGHKGTHRFMVEW